MSLLRITVAKHEQMRSTGWERGQLGRCRPSAGEVDHRHLIDRKGHFLSIVGPQVQVVVDQVLVRFRMEDHRSALSFTADEDKCWPA